MDRSRQIFISHASKDDDFVKQLRLALEGHQLTVWVDSRNLRGGAKLAPEISDAIRNARQTLVVLSPNTINSPWVRNEIQQALSVEKELQHQGYRVIPLLLPGVEPSALSIWFDEEPVGIRVELKIGSVGEALPKILVALGERMPDDVQPPETMPQKPVEELLVKLSDPKVETRDGKRRASATAVLVYEPADATSREVESKRFTFTAPLGPIEADELRWYLEEFYRWPTGVFQGRAERVEAQLPTWGKQLFDEAAKTDSAKDTLNVWRNAADGAERRFSVEVDSELPEGAVTEDQAAAKEAAANEAASVLLLLPWELLHDGRGFLFHGKNPVRVRRRLPNRYPQPSVVRELPIRILLVSPRPEEKGAGYIDHRISAKPLVEAIENLGDLAELTILTPPTFAALEAELTRASDAGHPYDVVHFDGHGVYDRKVGLGALCFEDPKDADKLEEREMQLVYGAVSDAERAKGKSGLAEVMRDHRIPLVFLEACQSALTREDPSASVAVSLLNEGVTSVVAMSHSVLVETAHRFVRAFYGELVNGARIGTAMLAGQRALQTNSYRGKIAGAGDLRLQDWFVPVLYQEAQDLRLVPQRPSSDAQQLDSERRRLSLGRLPPEPVHTFIGRSRELLALERLLLPAAPPELRYAVVRGVGGEGKTTLAVELARWMVRTNRFERAAFVSFDPNDKHPCSDARGLLDGLGNQLLPEGEGWSVAQYQWNEAVQKVERALRDHATILVLDNLESVLPSGNSGLSPVETGENSPEIHHWENEEHTSASPVGTTEETIAQSDSAVPPGLDAQPRDDSQQSTAGLLSNVPPGQNRSSESPAAAALTAILGLCQVLLRADPATRIVFTSRERLPAPFNHPQREIPLGRLSREDAVELVSQVLRSVHRALPEAEQPGGTALAILDLVETANRHARALVLLSRELADRDLRSTTDDLREVLAELDRRHPGDRENSLYASVELSLRRLPADLREKVKSLAVFHGGAHLTVLDAMLETDKDDVETVQRLAAALIEVGLAEAMPYGHLRLDPALPNYLLASLDAAELPSLTARWGEAMRALTGFLYQQRFEDIQLAAQLTLMELRNLQAMLAWAAGALPPEEVVDLADSVETLLARLGRPQALAQAVSVRTAAANRLGAWSHAQYMNADKNIDRLLDQGDVQAAYTAAQQLLQRCQSAGAEAYPGAAYAIATAHSKLGRVLKTGGAAEDALSPLVEAQQRFQALADEGNTAAARMASTAITERADCLRDLGRYEDAAAVYQEAIRRNEERGHKRDVATVKFQLGTVRMLQKRYDEALERYGEALKTFESLGEPDSVATAWHQIGMVHKNAGQFEQAEQAYRQSLAIHVQQKNRSYEASSLNELGSLYNQMGRLEEAVTFYRQAADIDVKLQDLRGEGMDRSNLADTLIKLQRYDEARRELRRAIECKKPLGHAAKLWTTWNILRDLELATGNAQAAAEARAKAVASYLAYRRAGGESRSNRAHLFALVVQAIAQGTTTEATAQLAAYAEPDDPGWFTALLDKLQAILGGSRDPVLAADPDLYYMDAVELQLLLETLSIGD